MAVTVVGECASVVLNLGLRVVLVVFDAPLTPATCLTGSSTRVSYRCVFGACSMCAWVRRSFFPGSSCQWLYTTTTPAAGACICRGGVQGAGWGRLHWGLRGAETPCAPETNAAFVDPGQSHCPPPLRTLLLACGRVGWGVVSGGSLPSVQAPRASHIWLGQVSPFPPATPTPPPSRSRRGFCSRHSQHSMGPSTCRTLSTSWAP